MHPAASIDIGSNTVRLLAASVRDGRIVKEVLDLRAVTRLSEGLRQGGRLDPEARERTVAVLKGYAAKAKEAGVKEVAAVATEVLRKASDAADFVAEVKEKTGMQVEIISGEEEARRMLMGVRAGIGDAAPDGPKLLIDIGGGSTELVYTGDWREFKAVSLPLGAVSLYEEYLLTDPPSDEELEAAGMRCFRELSVIQKLVPEGEIPMLIGTAGTITTLAAVDLALEQYEASRVTGHLMGRETVARLLFRFARLPKESRKILAGIEPGREDIILSGTLILLAVMEAAGVGSLAVCDSGLREGNLLYYFEKSGR